jgi:hypothetical protein
MTLENLFNIHYAFYDFKIAINYFPESRCLPFTNKPNELQKLPGKLLKTMDWEVLDLSESEFKAWDRDDKVSNIKGWLKEAKQRQVKKGVAKEWEKPI